MRAEFALRRYVKLWDYLTTPSSLDVYCDEGKRYVISCPICRARIWDYNEELGEYFCKKCHNLRTKENVRLKRGEIQENPRLGMGAQNAMAELSDLRLKLDRAREEDELAFTVFFMYYMRDIGGHRKLAEYGQKHWPEAPFIWTKDRVADLIRMARMSIERQFEGG